MNILQEADKIINGERRQAYGPVKESFDKVAKLWSVAVGKDITAPQVALMMILFKVARELNAHKSDNLTDIAGYAQLEENLYEADPIQSWMDSEDASRLQ
jgi:hypothetical protein